MKRQKCRVNRVKNKSLKIERAMNDCQFILATKHSRLFRQKSGHGSFRFEKYSMNIEKCLGIHEKSKRSFKMEKIQLEL